ncbi:hypothetical protein TNCV_1882541 [Trichonephila clavipes]|nr:hypothetical protein TNCV_1882541 [Trichonephila clavipes]
MYGFPMFSQRESLLKRHENDPFLKRIITGDEKWVLNNNVQHKRSRSKKYEPTQTISKADIPPKKSCLINEYQAGLETEHFGCSRQTVHLVEISSHASQILRSRKLIPENFFRMKETKDVNVPMCESGNPQGKVAQQPMRAKAYCAYLSVRYLRCWGVCADVSDQEVRLTRNLQCSDPKLT